MDSTADGNRTRRKKVHRSDPKTRERAEELHAQGMPFQMAMAVALGRVDLNTALERLARQNKVERLMEQHELSRALATQIALGHADLELVLARRRMAVHREANRLKSCLETAVATQQPIALALHGRRRVVVVVQSIEPYSITVVPILKDGEPGPVQEIHKLQLKYAYAPDDYKLVRKAARADKRLSREPLGPIERPQDRYTCSDKRLFRYMDQDVQITVTLLEGDQFRGHVTWFGRYEFGVQLRTEAEITVFRHALHEIGT